jgi:hypothetical protein
MMVKPSQAKGARKYKERGPKSNPKAHKPKGGLLGAKETNYVPELLPVARSILQKEKEGKPENVLY